MNKSKLNRASDSEQCKPLSQYGKETLRLSLVRLYRLKIDTTMEQIGIWLKSKDFEKHENFLRLHFIQRLEVELNHLSASEILIRFILNGETLSTQTSWIGIHAVIVSLLKGDMSDSLTDNQDGLAEALGFPPETAQDMMDCVENGMEHEANKNRLGQSIH